MWTCTCKLCKFKEVIDQWSYLGDIYGVSFFLWSLIIKVYFTSFLLVALLCICINYVCKQFDSKKSLKISQWVLTKKSSILRWNWHVLSMREQSISFITHAKPAKKMKISSHRLYILSTTFNVQSVIHIDVVLWNAPFCICR